MKLYKTCVYIAPEDGIGHHFDEKFTLDTDDNEIKGFLAIRYGYHSPLELFQVESYDHTIIKLTSGIYAKSYEKILKLEKEISELKG